MTTEEIKNLLHKCNCTNCGTKRGCHTPHEHVVCSYWEPMSCKHEEVIVPYESGKIFEGFPNILPMKCRKCGEEIYYAQIHCCKDCKYFRQFAVGDMLRTSCNRDRLVCPKETDYCSKWEKK